MMKSRDVPVQVAHGWGGRLFRGPIAGGTGTVKMFITVNKKIKWMYSIYYESSQNERKRSDFHRAPLELLSPLRVPVLNLVDLI